MFVFLFLSSIAYSLKDNQHSPQQSQFSLSINQKLVTMYNPNKYLKDMSEKQENWFYVHFLINNISNIKQFIQIKPTNMLIKNTYILFLSKSQLFQISNISLVKIIEPDDKSTFSDDQLMKSKYFIIHSSTNFELDHNSNLFTIKDVLSENYFIIKTKSESIQSKKRLIKILRENPFVRSISIYKKPVLMNNIMAGYTQKNTFDFKRDEKTGYYYSDRYLNDKGLNGEGQIVTMPDTFIDFNHAMFYDPESTFDVNVPLNHRKFAYYFYKGTVDELRKKILNKEHGTHVAATIAGDSQNCEGDDESLKIFNGNAPKARLIYFKLNSYKLEDVVEIMNKFNSKISSNSWDYMGYDDDGNFQYGLAAMKHPELIFIFAAGNEYQGGNFTIDDPSGSKNILSVGSIDDFYNEKRLLRLQKDDDPSVYIEVEELKMYDPYIKGVLGTDVNNSDIVILNGDEVDDCGIFEEDRLFINYVSSAEKVNWLSHCYNFVSKGVFISYDIEKVKSFLDKAKGSIVTAMDATQINKSKSVEHAYFSSGGPGNKGAMKPDVMAPGRRIFSAKSIREKDGFYGCRENGSSDVVIKEGTSQATPMVSGSAALILQYFESGRWNLKSNINSSVVLDGPTIRALLINSCVHPHGSKTPDVLFGHGAIDLSTVLPFDDQFGLQITDQKVKPTIGQNGHKVSSIKVTSNKKKLQITLSYLDNILSAESPILLVHDLDLVVVSPTGKVFKGDHIETGDSQHLSTNEKVIVNEDEIELGEYEIHVYSGNFIDADIETSTQDFSVVATGSFDNGYLTFSEAENCGCDKCSKENPLHCKCDENSIGPICQGHLSIQIGKVKNYSVTLKPHEIRRFNIVEKRLLFKMNYITKIEVETFDDVGLSSVWIDKDCHLQLGEFESYIGTFEYETNFTTEITHKSSHACIAIFNNNFKESSFYITVTRTNKTNYVFIAIGSLVAIVLIIIIVVVVVKSVRNRERKGFTKFDSLYTK